MDELISLLVCVSSRCVKNCGQTPLLSDPGSVVDPLSEGADGNHVDLELSAEW